MIYSSRPPNFASDTHVVAAYIEWGGFILHLQRSFEKPEGGFWGLPAGKVERGESHDVAVLREIYEETGLKASFIERFGFQKTFFVVWRDKQFSYHVFRGTCTQTPHITLNASEHCGYGWFSPKESLKLRLVPDQARCTRLIYGLP